ncbi:MAG: tetratricopeptide repeat-containing sensor histidine kinase [Bacteroidota bacterium]
MSIGNIYSNLAVTYKNTKQLDSALYYYDKAREEFEASGNVLVSGVYCNIGILYGDLKKYDQAEKYLQQALTLTRSFKQINYEVNVLNSLAEIRLSTQNYREAIEYASQSLELAKSKGLLQAQSQSLKYLHISYAKLGKYEMAYSIFTEAAALNDSLYSIEKEEVVKEIKEKYESDKKDEEITSANTRIEEEKQRSYYLWATILTFGGFIVFIWFLYVRTGKLNTKIAAQAKAIETQNADLEQVNQVKNKLFAVVSHDLRAPVSSLHSLLMLINNPNLSSEKKEMMHHQLQAELEQTTILMETLLHWAKTQMKGWEVKKEKVEFNGLITGVFRQFEKTAKEKKIELSTSTIGEDVFLNADPHLLHIILYNLVSNGIKFTHKHGSVWIEYHQYDSKVLICVCDEGTGITEEEITLLLNESSYKTTRGTASEKGFGMGLKICMELARQMNGTITVQSNPEDGSRFCLEMPV